VCRVERCATDRTKEAPIVQRFAAPIKQLIKEHPGFGYRTVAHLLKFNKNAVERVSS
jgi:putative transposase